MVAITTLILFHEIIIETTVTNEVSIAKSWILAVRLENQEDPTVIVSLNSKTNPQDDAKTATVQLCIKTKCLILQLLHMNQNTNLEECLGDLFRDERFVFVGIGIAETTKKLDGQISVVKKVDVRDLVKVNYPFSYGVRRRLSLKAMACELLGFGSWKPKREICPRDLTNTVLDEEKIWDETESDKEFYAHHKASPLSEIKFADTRKPITQTTDGTAYAARKDVIGWLPEQLDTAEESLKRATLIFKRNAERGDPETFPHSRILRAMRGEWF